MELVDSRYNNGQVSDILRGENIKNKDEIIESLFESQKGYKLLIITFFAQKKVEEKGFLEELEKNYGIYLDVDGFIEGMQKKLDEIKTFKQLLEFVGSDFGKDKTDMEIIIEAYDKAKQKNYITLQNIHQNDNNNIINNNNIFGGNNSSIRNWNIRGRGRGRGRGRDIGRGRGRGRGRVINLQVGNRRDFGRRRSRSRSRSNSNNQ